MDTEENKNKKEIYLNAHNGYIGVMRKIILSFS